MLQCTQMHCFADCVLPASAHEHSSAHIMPVLLKLLGAIHEVFFCRAPFFLSAAAALTAAAVAAAWLPEMARGRVAAEAQLQDQPSGRQNSSNMLLPLRSLRTDSGTAAGDGNGGLAAQQPVPPLRQQQQQQQPGSPTDAASRGNSMQPAAMQDPACLPPGSPSLGGHEANGSAEGYRLGHQVGI